MRRRGILNKNSLLLRAVVVLSFSAVLFVSKDIKAQYNCRQLFTPSSGELVAQTLRTVEGLGAVRELPSLNTKNIAPTNYAIQALARRIFEQETIDPLVQRLILENQRGQQSEKASLKEKEVVVVGGGPLGLITGLLAYKSGKNVKLIERRSEYLRDEIMGMDPTFFNFLHKNFPELVGEMLSLGILVPRPGWSDLRVNGAKDESFYSIRIQQLEHSFSLLYDRIYRLSSNPSPLILRGYSYLNQWRSQSGLHVLVRGPEGFLKTLKAYFVIGADGFSGTSTRSYSSMSYTTNQPTIKALFKTPRLEQADAFAKRWDGQSLREIMNAHPKKEQWMKELVTLGWRPQELGLPAEALPSFRIFQNGDQFYIATTLNPSLARAMELSSHLSRNWFLTLREIIFPKSEIRDLLLREETIGRIDPELRALDDPATIYKNVDGEVVGLFVALGDRAANAHYMTRSGINSGARHMINLNDNIFSLNGSQRNDVKLQHSVEKYREVVREEFDHLLKKATTKKHFWDAGFVERLTPFQVSLGRSLQELGGLQHVKYFHISALQKMGYNPNFVGHRRGLEKVATLIDPNENFTDFLSLFQKQLYSEF